MMLVGAWLAMGPLLGGSGNTSPLIRVSLTTPLTNGSLTFKGTKTQEMAKRKRKYIFSVLR